MKTQHIISYLRKTISMRDFEINIYCLSNHYRWMYHFFHFLMPNLGHLVCVFCLYLYFDHSSVILHQMYLTLLYLLLVVLLRSYQVEHPTVFLAFEMDTPKDRYARRLTEYSLQKEQ